MSGLLYRLGRACAGHGWRVVALWLVVLTAMGAAVASGSTRTADDFSLPGTEAFDALDRLGAAFPGADGTSAQLVFAAPAGQAISSPQDRQVVAEAVAALAAGPQVASVDDPFVTGAVSPDGRIAYASVQYTVAVDALEPAARDALYAAADQARAAGLTVEVGGEAAIAAAEIGLTSEIIGMAIALIVLLVTLGTLVAAGLPLLTALVGIGIGLFGILLVGRVVDLSSTAPILALMIGLAVGVDYALFVVSRHRSQLAAGMPVRESIARATATAGGAVVFAGLTVVVALAGLSLIGIPFLTVMGLAAAATVMVAVLIAVTLLPGLLGLLGHRIDAVRVRRRPLPVPPRDRTAGGRWVRLVTARPVLTLLVGILALGVLALPLTSLRLGLPGSESASTERSDRRAYDLVAEGFGPGANGPLVVLVEADRDVAVTAEATARELATIPGVAAAVPPVVAPDGATALLTVIPTTGPADEATTELVERIRARAAGLEQRYDATVSVTGTTAANIDLSETLYSALPVFVLVIVGLALILLTLAFRSVVVTVKAILGFLLTIAATGGAVVAVFQWGWLAGPLGVDQVGPILNFLPILLIGILFGLAMDYELFLVSRMREEHLHGNDARHSVHLGFAHGARVVTAAALIMTAVFAGFFLADDPIIKSIGFALTVGVLIDAFVIRMTLVPAAMTLLAERAWTLPRWLDRALPHLDIEGGTPHPDRTVGTPTSPTPTEPGEDSVSTPRPVTPQGVR
ncbi:MMPL family transporter [Micromonospora sp. BQ11]|uniref:MMPL family transporter n=1 Tax=Micromonospora sp. BQ11 TaxID=3452212 RepID=UPI003F8C8021